MNHCNRKFVFRFGPLVAHFSHKYPTHKYEWIQFRTRNQFRTRIQFRTRFQFRTPTNSVPGQKGKIWSTELVRVRNWFHNFEFDSGTELENFRVRNWKLNFKIVCAIDLETCNTNPPNELFFFNLQFFFKAHLGFFY